jgi:hypothetical protein
MNAHSKGGHDRGKRGWPEHLAGADVIDLQAAAAEAHRKHVGVVAGKVHASNSGAGFAAPHWLPRIFDRPQRYPPLLAWPERC